MTGGSTDAKMFHPLALNDASAESALASLYRRYWRELCIYVSRSLDGGPPEPEDVAQAAFERYAALPDKASIQNPRAFLYATARNIVFDHRRRACTADRHSREYLHNADHDQRYEISPERVLIGKERLQRLLTFLAKMPERRRRAILLHRMEGLSVQEVADRFGMTERATAKQIARALESCMKHLEDPDEEEKPKGLSEKLK